MIQNGMYHQFAIERTLVTSYLSWLYWRSIVIDGNFKAEHLKMRNPSDDVSLTDGDLYMVSPDKYERHLHHAKENYTASSLSLAILLNELTAF